MNQEDMNLTLNTFVVNWQYLNIDVEDLGKAVMQGSIEVARRDIERATERLEFLREVCDELEAGDAEE